MNIDLDLAAMQNFAIAILIGALIGIEREKRRETETTIGGIRTFVLLAMLGAVGGFLSQQFDTVWPLVVIVALGGVTVVAGFLIDADERKGQIGLITELAAIVVTVLAGLATLGQPALAVCLGIVVAALLAYKQPLHGLIDKIGWDDIFAGLRLLIASFIILPLLPDQHGRPVGRAQSPQAVAAGGDDLRPLHDRLCRDPLARSGPGHRHHRPHRRAGVLDRGDARLLAPEQGERRRAGGADAGDRDLDRLGGDVLPRDGDLVRGLSRPVARARGADDRHGPGVPG